MVTVYLQEGESFDGLLRRFRKKVQGSRILSDVRKRRYFISKGEQERFTKKRGIRRAKRRQRRQETRWNRRR